MAVILDAGGFLAIERGDRDTMAILKRERLAGRTPLTHGGVVGQVWRGGSGRQANVARAIAGTQVAPLDEDLGRRSGVVLTASATSDVIDAAVVLMARDGDEIYTSDPDGLVVLASVLGIHVDIVPL